MYCCVEDSRCDALERRRANRAAASARGAGLRRPRAAARGDLLDERVEVDAPRRGDEHVARRVARLEIRAHLVDAQGADGVDRPQHAAGHRVPAEVQLLDVVVHAETAAGRRTSGSLR